LSFTSALALDAPSRAIVPVPNAFIAVGLSASSSVCLDDHNFMLWKGLTVPALPGAGLYGNLDGTAAAPAKTIKEGIGDAAMDVPNPEYSRRWVINHRFLSFLLGSMDVWARHQHIR
jgi:hypothetical protein